ncbi:SdrD B-like domain-containing protein [Patescibacteria group bacterium]
MYKIIKKSSDKIIAALAIFSLLFNLSQPILIVYAQDAAEGVDEEVVVEDEASEEESSDEEEATEEEAVVDESEEETSEDADASGTSVPVEGEEEEATEETSDEEAVVEEDGTGDTEEEVVVEEIVETDGTGEEEEVIEEEVVETDGVEPGVEVIEEETEEVETVCLGDDVEIVDSEEADWEINDDVAETKENVKLGVKYIFPLEEEVSVTFTCLPKNEDGLSKLKIERLEIDDLDLPEDFVSASEYAFDITTDMEDGDFEYELTLPASDTAADLSYIEKSSEEMKTVKVDESDFSKIEDVEKEEDKITAKNLDHLTVFIIGTFSDATFTVSENTYAQGEKVFMKAETLDDSKYYRIDVYDFSDNYVGNAYSCSKNETIVEVTDFTLASDAPIGVDWVAELTQYSSKPDCDDEENVELTEEAFFEVVAGTGSTATTYAQCIEDFGGRMQICHARGNDQYNLLTLPCNAIYGRTENSGHFNENGTTSSGHEDDAVALDGLCPGDIIETFYCGDGLVNNDEQCDDGNGNDDDYCTTNCTFGRACLPDVNMVSNGGFETPVVSASQMWDIFTQGFVGWDVNWYGGSTSFGGQARPDDAFLELHRGVNGWSPAEGNQYAELDTDWDGPGGSLSGEPASVAIHQDLPTISGYKYRVEFSFSPRPSTPGSDNQLEFRWDGNIEGVYSDSGGINWSTEVHEFIADDTQTRIQFADIGDANSLGTFLDDVKVTCLGPTGGSIYGMKYDDLDGNGERGIEPEEPGLPGWTINIKDVSGAPIDTTVTDEFGHYQFDNLPFGEYEVCEVLQGGWINTDPGDSLCKPVHHNPELQNFVEFGNMRDAICGNGIHEQENFEQCDGEDGVTEGIDFCTPTCELIRIYDGEHTCPEGMTPSLLSEHTLDSTSSSPITISFTKDVPYLFNAYGVYQYADNANKQADPAYGTNDNWVSLRNDIGIWGTNRGVTSILGSLGKGWGLIEWDDDETPNVEHSYFKAFTPTDDIDAQFVISDWYSDWYQNSSCDNQSCMHDNTGVLNLDIYECVSNGSIQGRKYRDVNANGTFDQNEKKNVNRLNGWTVELYDDQWAPLGSVVTGSGNLAKGQYRFENLIPGTYHVCEIMKDGWYQTEPDFGESHNDSYCHTINLEPGADIGYVHFGNYEGYDVKVCKQNTNREGLSGWTVMLRGETPEETVTVTPDGGGYKSSDLSEGDYALLSHGTYEYRGSSGLLTDPAYSERMEKDGYSGPFFPWINTMNLNTTGALGIMINDTATKWGDYLNDDHKYALGFKDHTGEFKFSVYDDNYTDNVGDMYVDIYEGWVGTTGDDGCYTFEDVKEGDYVVEEIGQHDWEPQGGTTQNVSINVENNEFLFTNKYVAPVTIIATKIVCDDEGDLPNWGPSGQGPGLIKASTAEDYVLGHEGCELVEGWEFQWGTDANTNPGDAEYGPAVGWNNFDTTTDVNGEAVVTIYNIPENLKQGIKVREVLKTNYTPFTFTLNGGTNVDDYSAEIYCHDDILNYDNDDRVRGVEYGETYYCVAWNVEHDDLEGYKRVYDSDGKRVFEICEEEGSGPDNQTQSLSESVQKRSCWNPQIGWTVYIDDNENGQHDPEEQSTTTDSNGYYVFKKLQPGDYRVCEKQVEGDGWQQTYPENNGCWWVSLPNECGAECGNDFENRPTGSLTVTKENDTGGSDQSPGDIVQFTMTVTAVGGPVNKVLLTDLPADGFDFVETSGFADNGASEPIYASPGEWVLGNIPAGDTVEITYNAEIESTTGAGTYKDVAWAVGEDVLGGQVLADAVSPGDIDTNFVGTEVNVVVDPETDEAIVEVEEETIHEEEVLGASTYLPATGSDTDWLYAALTALLIGLVNIFVGTMLMRKKFKDLKLFAVTGLVFAYAFIFSGNVFAETMVRIEEPESIANGPFEISFVVQDTEDGTVKAQCQVKKPGSGTFTDLGSPFTMPGGGNTDVCDVNNSVLTSNGNYEFKVIASIDDWATEVEDATGAISYDGEGPERPKYIEKDKDGSCQFEITVKTHADGQTAYIEVYADDDKNIEANAGSRIKTVVAGPSEKVEFDHDLFGPDCGTTFYYATRAFDAAHNPSDLRVEELTDTKTVTTTTTDEGTEETFGAIPVSGEGSILGDATDADEDKDSDSEDGDVLGEDADAEDMEDGILGGTSGKMGKALRWAAIIVVVVFFANVIKKKAKKKQE